jgi:hypothetical protein
MAGSADHPDHGPKAGHALTFNPDHLTGPAIRLTNSSPGSIVELESKHT